MKEIGQFEIPKDVGVSLSSLLIKREIHERMLLELIGTDRYAIIEDELVDIIKRINSLKAHITADHVPNRFKQEMYTWNYNGYETDGVIVRVYEN